MAEQMFPVYEFRPLTTGEWAHRKWVRYAEGKWLPDDGEHDIAFYTVDSYGAPFALGVDIPYQKNIIWSWLPGHWRADGPVTHPRLNPWHHMLKDGETEWGGDWRRDLHPNRRAYDQAMNLCCGMHRCANGRGPEFHIGDPYIAAGLVHVRDTKEIVRFPEVFNCMYCGVVHAKDKAA